MSEVVGRIVVVGGGSAGWLAAGVIAAGHRSGDPRRVQVTVVESPDVRTIGVGEGPWPSMRDTLRRIGVSETEFIRDCDASFKQGSKFVGWVTGGNDDQYFHPFALPQGYTEADLVAQWQAGHADIPFADLVSYQPHLCRLGRAPKQIATPEFAAVANYAYHLDGLLSSINSQKLLNHPSWLEKFKVQSSKLLLERYMLGIAQAGSLCHQYFSWF